MHHKIVLAVDTSSTFASYAIARDGQLLTAISAQGRMPHSQTFFDSLEQLLDQTKLDLTHVDLFAAVNGPGSFTGLRVGLAAIKGLAQTLARPVYGVDAITLTALSVGLPGAFVVALEAGRNEVFIGKRMVNVPGEIGQFEPDWVGSVESLPKAFQSQANNNIYIGSGVSRLQSKFINQVDQEPLSLAATLAIHSHNLLAGGKGPYLHAYYLRPSDAEVKSASPSL